MRVLDISFRQIRYFVSTAELGQVSLAAHELNITQSAITIAIKELENKLNVLLFTRSAKRMILTEQGKSFLSHCYEMLNILESSQNLHNNNDEISGEIKIGASYTVLGYYLPSHIQRLQNMYPKVTFTILEMPREELENNLLNEQLDLAVLLSSNVNHPELEVQTFLQSPRCLWVPSGHHLLQKKHVFYEDIVHEPYIMLTVDEAQLTTEKHWHQHTQNPPNIFIKTSSIEAVRSMVANGSGISILSNTIYRPWSLEGKRINRIKLANPVPSMDLGVAWKAKKNKNRLQKIVANYFLPHFDG